MCVGKNNFVDTPGLGDSGGKDSEHLAECEKLGSVNAMVLVLNSTLPRIDEPIRDALSLFNQHHAPEPFSVAHCGLLKMAKGSSFC